jgi:hypothetical protein
VISPSVPIYSNLSFSLYGLYRDFQLEKLFPAAIFIFKWSENFEYYTIL